MNKKVFDSFSEAYIYILKDIFLNPNNDIDYNDSEAGKGKKYNQCSFIEKLNYSFTIKNPNKEEYPRTCSEKRNQILKDYMDKETILFDKGDDNSSQNMEQISKVWKLISNPDGTINSNYGLMVYHIKDCGNKKHAPDEEFINQWVWAK